MSQLTSTQTNFIRDEELFKVVIEDNFSEFQQKHSSPYIEQIRFTENLWSLLHLTVYFRRQKMTDVVLETELGQQFLNAKDKNGETPLHLAAFNFDIEMAQKLIMNGATLENRNIYSKDPVQVITNFVKRKAFVKKLLEYSSKLNKKEIEILNKHWKDFDYLEALGEIIYAVENRNQFIIERGAQRFNTGPKRNVADVKQDIKAEIKNFKLGIRLKEEFFDIEKAKRRQKQRIKESQRFEEEFLSKINTIGVETYNPSPFKLRGVPEQPVDSYGYSHFLYSPIISDKDFRVQMAKQEPDDQNEPHVESTLKKLVNTANKVQNLKFFENTLNRKQTGISSNNDIYDQTEGIGSSNHDNVEVLAATGIVNRDREVNEIPISDYTSMGYKRN